MYFLDLTKNLSYITRYQHFRTYHTESLLENVWGDLIHSYNLDHLNMPKNLTFVGVIKYGINYS